MYVFPTVAAEATFNCQDVAASCNVRRCGVTCHCSCGSLEADCCGSGDCSPRNPSLDATATGGTPASSQSPYSRRAHSNVRHDTGPWCTCRFPLSRCTVQVCSYQRAESSETMVSLAVSFPVVHVRCKHTRIVFSASVSISGKNFPHAHAESTSQCPDFYSYHWR